MSLNRRNKFSFLYIRDVFLLVLIAAWFTQTDLEGLHFLLLFRAPQRQISTVSLCKLSVQPSEWSETDLFSRLTNQKSCFEHRVHFIFIVVLFRGFITDGMYPKSGDYFPFRKTFTRYFCFSLNNTLVY